ncbi:hypothetical protein LP414_33125 [Polaromonas sp. P1(28)-13]|nr:hypothetical protein LP414_33125 [Polaromonas sp. P1(28)-13]
MQNVLSLLPWPALMAGGVALLVAVLLVVTQHWHGHLSMDSTFGVQRSTPAPRRAWAALPS